MRPTEVFLSHAARDVRFARKLRSRLAQLDVPVWLAPTELKGAQEWHDEIGRALERCDWMVLVLSPDAIVSKWVKRELVFALNEDRFVGRIVPLLYRPCGWKALSWTLGQIQRIDFQRFDLGLRELLAVWGIELLSEAKARSRRPASGDEPAS